MKIKRFTLGELRSNCYIVYENNQAFIIDPGYPSQEVLDFIKTMNLTVEFIYLTHGHPDHIGGVDFLNKTLKVDVYAPKNDRWWIDTYAPSKGLKTTVDYWITEPFSIPFNNRNLNVFEVPGHSLGSTILYDEINRIMFTGDTLFYETIGRTDIPYANQDVLINSIKRILKSFPKQTKVLPGHGIETTIDHEIKHNPFIK